MAFYDRNRTSGRLGAGAVQAAQDATSDAAGGATPADSANAGLDAIGAPTSHVAGAGGRATGGMQRAGIGLGRRAMNASRNFYSTDPRYTANTGYFDAPEQQKVYSNDGGVSSGTVRDLGQVQAEEQAAKPAPMAPAPQQAMAAPSPAPAPAVAQPAPVAAPVPNATSPGLVRQELAQNGGQPAPAPVPTTPTASLVGNIRSDLTSGNLSGRLDSSPAPSAAPVTQQLVSPSSQAAFLSQFRRPGGGMLL